LDGSYSVAKKLAALQRAESPHNFSQAWTASFLLSCLKQETVIFIRFEPKAQGLTLTRSQCSSCNRPPPNYTKVRFGIGRRYLTSTGRENET